MGYRADYKYTGITYVCACIYANRYSDLDSSRNNIRMYVYLKFAPEADHGPFQKQYAYVYLKGYSQLLHLTVNRNNTYKYVYLRIVVMPKYK